MWSSRLPHILLLMADDLSHEDLGYMGSPVMTPHIDALAASATAFSQFRSMPWCAPSRYALLTGRTVYSSVNAGKTLVTALRQQGFSTALVGKNHVPLGELWLQDDWDFFAGFNGGHCGSYWRLSSCGAGWLRRNTSRGRAVAFTEHLKPHVTDVIAYESVEFIRVTSVSPCFLWVSFTAPHVPHEPPMAHAAPYLHMGLGRSRANLFGLIDHLDAAVGHVLEAARRSWQPRELLTIFMSDNGSPMNLGCTAFRGGKGLMYEGGMRVPFLLQYPPLLANTNSISTSLHIADVAKFLLRLLTETVVDADGPRRGRPVSVHMLLPAAIPLRLIRDHGPMFQSGALLITRKQQHLKLVVSHTSRLNLTADTAELFDLDRDPLETMNLIGTMKQDLSVERLVKDSLGWLLCGRSIQVAKHGTRPSRIEPLECPRDNAFPAATPTLAMHAGTSAGAPLVPLCKLGNDLRINTSALFPSSIETCLPWPACSWFRNHFTILAGTACCPEWLEELRSTRQWQCAANNFSYGQVARYGGFCHNRTDKVMKQNPQHVAFSGRPIAKHLLEQRAHEGFPFCAALDPGAARDQQHGDSATPSQRRNSVVVADTALYHAG